MKKLLELLFIYFRPGFEDFFIKIVKVKGTGRFTDSTGLFQPLLLEIKIASPAGLDHLRQKFRHGPAQVGKSFHGAGVPGDR